MPDFTPHQKKIIDRYYDKRDDIMLGKLSEMVSELYLAESDRKRDQLWNRVESAMKNLKVPDQIATKILADRKPDLLARHLKDWLSGRK